MSKRIKPVLNHQYQLAVDGDSTCVLTGEEAVYNSLPYGVGKGKAVKTPPLKMNA